MFVVCFFWFEIDERKWIYYRYGLYIDWEFGVKILIVLVSKVLDSEWYCFIICRIF